MAKIINVTKEQVPKLRFIGIMYKDKDRDYGSFSKMWQLWFEKGYFQKLESINANNSQKNDYIGLMRSYPNFEYWIGMFKDENTKVPEGFDYIDLKEGEIAVAYIKGKEDGSDGIFGMHDECLIEFAKANYHHYRIDETKRAFFFERYNCPRYTTKDENGNVILDYAAYLE